MSDTAIDDEVKRELSGLLLDAALMEKRYRGLIGVMASHDMMLSDSVFDVLKLVMALTRRLYLLKEGVPDECFERT